MKELINIFDDFNIQARIIPALLVFLPIYIYLLLNNIIDTYSLEEFFKNSVIYILIVAMLYRVIRNMGKKVENRMYKKLGAKPTTILLRYSDNTIDELTKTRYHKKLNQYAENVVLPIVKEQETTADDESYESAVNWLRKYANTNKDKELRTYQELKDYNFWRNLYAGKPIILITCLVSILIELFKLRTEKIVELINNPLPKCTVLFVMSIILIIAFFSIKKKYVKDKAFDYARTLLEVCDSLQGENVL